MEYILDELKQFIFNEVYNLENKTINYLGVYYKDNIVNNKNIDFILIITYPENFKKYNNKIYYKSSNIYREIIPHITHLFQIDKSIEYKKILEIKKCICDNINLNCLNQVNNIILESYVGKNNYIIYIDKSKKK